MIEILITAVITSLISAYIATKIQKHFEKKHENERRIFEVYMKLMELGGYYFWLYSFQTTGKKEPKEIMNKVWNLKWEIADALRKTDIDELEKTLQILFLEKFSHFERYEKTMDLIEELGNKTNPKYIKVMKEISKKNQKTIEEEMNIN